MKNIFALLIAFLLITKLTNAQTLPALLAAGDKPGFSYMECYPNIEDKKMRHCTRFDFIFKVQGDTLHFTQVVNEKAELPAKTKVSYTVDYAVALSDIFYTMTLMKLEDKTVSRVKDMQVNLSYFYQFTLYTKGIMKSSKGGKYKIDTIDLYSEDKSDAKKFLMYLQTLSK